MQPVKLKSGSVDLSHMFDPLLKLRETFLHCQQPFQPIGLGVLTTFCENLTTFQQIGTELVEIGKVETY